MLSEARSGVLEVQAAVASRGGCITCLTWDPREGSHRPSLGRVDNYQIGTFLAYVTNAGNRVLSDRELHIPQESWFGDRERCAEAAVPPDLQFATRPAQVIAMIARARQANVGFRWFTADEEFGQNPALRDYLENTRIGYVMAVPKPPSSPTLPVVGSRSKTSPRNYGRAPGRGVPAELERKATGSTTG